MHSSTGYAHRQHLLLNIYFTAHHTPSTPNAHQASYLPQKLHTQLLCYLGSTAVTKHVCMVAAGRTHIKALVFDHAQDWDTDLSKHFYSTAGINEGNILQRRGALGGALGGAKRGYGI